MPTEKNVVDYFESFLQKGFLKPWQFIQIVDAVCYLLRDAFKLDWAENFDWQSWRDAVKAVDSTNPTLAHELDIPEMIHNTVSAIDAGLQEHMASCYMRWCVMLA